MAGLFDDLIPPPAQASLFADLIPPPEAMTEMPGGLVSPPAARPDVAPPPAPRGTLMGALPGVAPPPEAMLAEMMTALIPNGIEGLIPGQAGPEQSVLPQPMPPMPPVRPEPPMFNEVDPGSLQSLGAAIGQALTAPGREAPPPPPVAPTLPDVLQPMPEAGIPADIPGVAVSPRPMPRPEMMPDAMMTAAPEMMGPPVAPPEMMGPPVESVPDEAMTAAPMSMAQLISMAAQGGDVEHGPAGNLVFPQDQGTPVDDPFADESMVDLAKRRGQQFARGAGQIPASVPERLAIAGAGNPNEAALVAEEEMFRARERFNEARTRLEDPSLSEENRASVEAYAREQANIMRSMGELVGVAEGPLKPDAQDRALYKAGDTVRGAVEDAFGAPDPRDTSFWGKFAEGGGNLAGFMATGLLTGPIGTVGVGSSLNSAEVYREARDAGATEEEARSRAGMAAVVGMSEALPIHHALLVLPPSVRNKVAGALGERLQQALLSAGEEGAQEALQGIANNLIASVGEGAYDPERGTFEGVGEQALIGSLLGVTANIGVQTAQAGSKKLSDLLTPDQAMLDKQRLRGASRDFAGAFFDDVESGNFAPVTVEQIAELLATPQPGDPNAVDFNPGPPSAPVLPYRAAPATPVEQGMPAPAAEPPMEPVRTPPPAPEPPAQVEPAQRAPVAPPAQPTTPATAEPIPENPTFSDFKTVLPLDENGDHDFVGRGAEVIQQVTGKEQAWGQLAPEDRREVIRVLRGEPEPTTVQAPAVVPAPDPTPAQPLAAPPPQSAAGTPPTETPATPARPAPGEPYTSEQLRWITPDDVKVSQKRSVEEGAVTSLEMPDGQVIRIQRSDGGDTGGVSGWHLTDNPEVRHPGTPPHTYVGDRKSDAVKAVLSMWKRGQTLAPVDRNFLYKPVPTPTPAPSPSPATSGMAMARGHEEEYQRKAETFVPLTDVQANEIKAVFPSEWGDGVTTDRAGKLVVPVPDKAKLGQAIIDTYNVETGIETTPARRRSMIALGQRLLREAAETPAPAAAVGRESQKVADGTGSGPISDIVREANARTKDQIDTPKLARAAFDKDMDEIANILEAMDPKDRPENIAYTLKRGTGETRYTLNSRDPENIRDFQKRMHKSMPLELGNTIGSTNAPVTVEQFLADRMGQITTGPEGPRMAKPSDVSETQVQQYGDEVGRPGIKRTDKITFAKQPSPKKATKGKVTGLNKFEERAPMGDAAKLRYISPDMRDSNPDTIIPAQHYIASNAADFDALGMTDAEVTAIAEAYEQFLRETSPEALDALHKDLEQQRRRIIQNKESLGPDRVRANLREDLDLGVIGMSLMGEALSMQAWEETVLGLQADADPSRALYQTVFMEDANVKRGDPEPEVPMELGQWAIAERMTREMFGEPDNRLETIGSRSESSLRDAAPAEPKAEEPRRVGRAFPKGAMGPSFSSLSFTDRNSVFNDAFAAAGIDPADAVNLPAARQIEILRTQIETDYGIKIKMPTYRTTRKTISGREAVEERQQIHPKDALDQLLDAWRQLQMLAHVANLPVSALALQDPVGDSKLALSMTRKLPGALGMYSHDPSLPGGARTIHLPGRSNSFAHEWGHALDHWINMLLNDGDAEDMFSRNLTEEGFRDTKGASKQIVDAFAGVMTSLFADRAKLAAFQIDLQMRAAARTPNGNLTRDAKAAQKALDDIAKGKLLKGMATSRYFKTSQEYEQQVGMGGYFTDPAEMFARAFEAWVGRNAARVSDLPAGFLSKGDWAYSTSDDTRATKTFPRGTDYPLIDLAFQRLMSALADTSVFGEDALAERPKDAHVVDMRRWNKIVPKTMLREELDTWKKVHSTLGDAVKNAPGRSKKTDWAWMFAQPLHARLHTIVRRQPKAAQKPLNALLDMFINDPGSGRAAGNKENWEQATERQYRRFQNQFKSIIDTHRLTSVLRDADNAREFRLAMTSVGVDKNDPFNPKFKATNPAIRKAAPHIRKLLDETWRYMRDAGVDVGYARNGYMPRVIDLQRVMGDIKGFTAQATKTYRVIFDRDVRRASVVEQVEDLTLIGKQMMNATRAQDGVGVSQNQFTSAQMDQFKAWLKAEQELRAAEKALARAINGGKVGPRAIANREAELEAAQAEFDDLHPGLLDMMEGVWSKEMASRWKHSLMTGNSLDFGSIGPTSNFKEKRALPPEADEYMNDFYGQDHVGTINNYLQRATRKAEFTRRAYNRDANGMAGESRIERLIDEAVENGAHIEAINFIHASIKDMTGNNRFKELDGLKTAWGWVYVAGTIKMLNRATFSSLVESATAGVRIGPTGKTPIRGISASIRNMYAFIRYIAMLGKGKRNRALKELAQVMGMVTASQYENLMLNRYGGDLDPTTRQSKLLSSFFRWNGLTGLTNIQRTTTLATSQWAIAGDIRNAVEKNSKRSLRALGELGISKREAAELYRWIKEDLGGAYPTADDLTDLSGSYVNPAAALWAHANVTLVESIVQNPKKYHRPAAAQSPRSQMAYGITGFTYAFHSEIIHRLTKSNYDVDDKGTGVRGLVGRNSARLGGIGGNLILAAAPMAMLYYGQGLAYMLRVAMTDPEDFEEKFGEKASDEDLVTYFFNAMNENQRQIISRSGLLGAYDIPYNAVTGAVWGRDLSSMLAGPYLSELTQAPQASIAQHSMFNAKGTNTYEWKAMNEWLDVIVREGAGLGLSAMPGAGITAPLKMGAYLAIDAADPATWATNQLLGEKGDKWSDGTGALGEFERGPNRDDD